MIHSGLATIAWWPIEHPGGGSRVDRGGDRLHVVLGQQHRELALVTPQLSDLGVLEVRELESFDRAVLVLLQDEPA
jgi:hypothetical protein